MSGCFPHTDSTSLLRQRSLEGRPEHRGGEMRRMVALLVVAAFVGTADAAPRIQAGARVFIESGETVDSSNSKNKADYLDFGLVLTAALEKKRVPVVVVTDPEKADYIIRHTSSMAQDSTGTRVAKMAFGFGFGGRGGTFEGSVNVIERESSAVVFSFTTKKGKAQSGAENFAGKFNALFR
jgi:hypothetical protein